MTGLVHRLRLRLLWVSLAAVAMILAAALTALPALPLVATALAGWAIAVHKIARSWNDSRCYACGSSLAEQPRGAHGCLCPSCGMINQSLAATPTPPALPAPDDEPRQA